jgi:flagellum-specific peptidoglycan hydrolase FlgJ
LPKEDYKDGQMDSEGAGYATDQNTDKLISYIERYNLGQYDAIVMGKDYTQLKSRDKNCFWQSK